jgi:hypothetical protein
MNHAFSLLRETARSRSLRLSDPARALVDGTETLTSLTAGRQQQPPATGRECWVRAGRRGGLTASQP